MAKRDWKEQFPEVAYAAESAAEEGRDAASRERANRFSQSQRRIKDTLDESGYRYTLGLVFWEKLEIDQPYLLILLYGKTLAKGKSELIPRHLIQKLKSELEGFFSAREVRVNFHPACGYHMAYTDVVGIGEMSKPAFHSVQNSPAQKKTHGRRNR